MILACLVIYVAVARLSFSDSRLLYNTWTYILSVPVSACLLAFLSHSLISRHAQRSIQIGIFFSLLLHLLLIVLAVNVVIFHQYLPNATGTSRSQFFSSKKSLPDNWLAQSTGNKDWSEPIVSNIDSKSNQPIERTIPTAAESPASLAAPRAASIELSDLNAIKPDLKFSSIEGPKIAGNQRSNSPKVEELLRATSPNNQPDAPRTNPSRESIVGSAEKKMLSEPRRVAPITSSINQSTNKAPSAFTTILPLEILTKPSDDIEPNISQLEGIRAKTPQTRTRPNETTSPDNSFDAEQIPVDPKTILSPREFGKTFDRKSSDASGFSARPDPLKDRLGAQTFTKEKILNESLAVLESNPDQPLSPSSQNRQRSLRTKVATGTSRLADSLHNPPPLNESTVVANVPIQVGVSDSATIKTEPRDPSTQIMSNSANKPEPLPNIAGMSQPSPNESRLTAPKISMESTPNLLSMDSARLSPSVTTGAITRPPERIDRTINPLNLRQPFIAPAPSFTQRILRMTDAKPTDRLRNPEPSEESETAIELGLSYLASVQNRDGSWSLQGHGSEVLLQSDTAATGLALLAFQGAGYTHQRDQYSNSVLRGIKFLISNQSSDGNLYRIENEISNQNVAFYSHGIAALALCEAYGMTKDPSLKTAAQQALDFISSTQHRQRGGWRYNAQISSDTSVTGWMMMALKSGELAGLETPAKTYRGISFWLTLAQSDENGDRYRYNPFAPDTPTQGHGRLVSPSMTAVAALMRMYSGWTRDNQELKSIADYLLEYPPQNGSSDDPKRDTYYWYYATQVMFHMGEKYWETWNSQLTPILLESQKRDGALAGSWDPISPVPDRWSVHAGRIYVTTMNLLNLEVYYRHLPIYDETANDQ